MTNALLTSRERRYPLNDGEKRKPEDRFARKNSTFDAKIINVESYQIDIFFYVQFGTQYNLI